VLWITRTGRSRPSPAPPFLHLAGVWILCAMILRWLRRAAAPKALSIVPPGDDRPQAQGTNDPDARQVEQLYEATEMTQVALAAKALNNLAMLYFEQGRDADAEPIFKCALAILNLALGPDQRTIEFASTSPRLQCTDQSRRSRENSRVIGW
jgi:hypothetical protein